MAEPTLTGNYSTAIEDPTQTLTGNYSVSIVDPVPTLTGNYSTSTATAVDPSPTLTGNYFVSVIDPVPTLTGNYSTSITGPVDPSPTLTGNYSTSTATVVDPSPTLTGNYSTSTATVVDPSPTLTGNYSTATVVDPSPTLTGNYSTTTVVDPSPTLTGNYSTTTVIDPVPTLTGNYSTTTVVDPSPTLTGNYSTTTVIDPVPTLTGNYSTSVAVPVDPIPTLTGNYSTSVAVPVDPSPTLTGNYSTSAATGVGLSPTLTGNYSIGAGPGSLTISEYIDVSDAISLDLGSFLSELIGISGTPLHNAIYFDRALKDLIGVSDRLKIILIGDLVDAVAIGDSLEVKKLVEEILADSFSVSGSISSLLNAVNIITETFELDDKVVSGAFETVLENVSLSDIATGIVKAVEAIIEDFAISSNIEFARIILEALSDSMALNDLPGSSGVLSECLSDGFAILGFGDELDDEGEVAFVMNPRTFAVWNYTNYNFNSLVSIGHTNLMASKDGLFISTGDTDEVFNQISSTFESEKIQARLKTAGIDFGTSNLKNIEQVYLGLTTDGEVTLVVTTDERVKAAYKLVTPTTHETSQSIRIGKGLLSSSFQLELITDTNTFRLDEVELYPVVFQRKRR